MTRAQLCHLDELDDIDSRGFEISLASGVHDIFIVRNFEILKAYQNSCPHNLAPLNWGEDAFLSMDKDYIQCANHGALFNFSSGDCVYGPCVGQKLDSVEIEIENNIIYALL